MSQRKPSIQHLIELLDSYDPAERNQLRAALQAYADPPEAKQQQAVQKALDIISQRREHEINTLKATYQMQRDHEFNMLAAAHQIDLIITKAESAAILRPDRILLGKLLSGDDQRLAAATTLFLRLAKESGVAPDASTVQWLGQFTSALSTATGATCDGGKDIRRLHAVNGKEKFQQLRAAIEQHYGRTAQAARKGHDLIAELAMSRIRRSNDKKVTTAIAEGVYQAVRELAALHPENAEVAAALATLDEASKPNAATPLRRKVKDIVDSYQSRADRAGQLVLQG